MKKFIFAGLLSLLFPHKVAAQPFQEVIYSPEKTVFTLFAPNDAKQVVVRIYDEGLGGKAGKTVKMKRTASEGLSSTSQRPIQRDGHRISTPLRSRPPTL